MLSLADFSFLPCVVLLFASTVISHVAPSRPFHLRRARAKRECEIPGFVMLIRNGELMARGSSLSPLCYTTMSYGGAPGYGQPQTRSKVVFGASAYSPHPRLSVPFVDESESRCCCVLDSLP